MSIEKISNEWIAILNTLNTDEQKLAFLVSFGKNIEQLVRGEIAGAYATPKTFNALTFGRHIVNVHNGRRFVVAEFQIGKVEIIELTQKQSERLKANDSTLYVVVNSIAQTNSIVDMLDKTYIDWRKK